MCMGLPDPDLLVRYTPRIRILLSSSKNNKKNTDFTVLWLLYDFCLKNVEKQNNFLLPFSRSGSGSASGSEAGSICQRYGSADPDPYQNFIDPQHWRKGNMYDKVACNNIYGELSFSNLSVFLPRTFFASESRRAGYPVSARQLHHNPSDKTNVKLHSGTENLLSHKISFAFCFFCGSFLPSANHFLRIRI
jgi:hypothetical protein